MAAVEHQVATATLLYIKLGELSGDLGERRILLGRAARSGSLSAIRPSAWETVLVIDDDPTARELITTHLREGGFAVKTASCGIDGLKLARELHPVAITLDILMPDIDGWTILAALK